MTGGPADAAVRGALLVFSSPASDDVADEFDRWYDEVHVPQVLERVPGLRSAQRYVFSGVQVPGVPAGTRRLTVYTVETSDLAGTLDALVTGTRDGVLDSSPVVDREHEPPEVMMFEELAATTPWP